MIQNKP